MKSSRFPLKSHEIGVRLKSLWPWLGGEEQRVGLVWLECSPPPFARPCSLVLGCVSPEDGTSFCNLSSQKGTLFDRALQGVSATFFSMPAAALPSASRWHSGFSMDEERPEMKDFSPNAISTSAWSPLFLFSFFGDTPAHKFSTHEGFSCISISYRNGMYNMATFCDIDLCGAFFLPVVNYFALSLSTQLI